MHDLFDASPRAFGPENPCEVTHVSLGSRFGLRNRQKSSRWKVESASQTIGLEHYVHDEGSIPSDADLFAAAERKVQEDEELLRALRAKQCELEALLRDAGGRDGDFGVDFLRNVVQEIFSSFKRQVAVENTPRMVALSKHNLALQDRVAVLSKNLCDRSEQLSKCRFAYFKEITHLRNQVYTKARDLEKYVPVEAYWFDPSDYLDEDLRLMLNEKIRLSVKMYHDRLLEMKRRLEDAEARLEQIPAPPSRLPEEELPLKPTLRRLCASFEATETVEALAGVANQEMQLWAERWALEAGMKPAAALEESLAELRRSKDEAARLWSEMNLQKSAAEEANRRAALASQEAAANVATSRPLAEARQPGADIELRDARTELAALRRQLQQEKSRAEEAERLLKALREKLPVKADEDGLVQQEHARALSLLQWTYSEIQKPRSAALTNLPAYAEWATALLQEMTRRLPAVAQPSERTQNQDSPMDTEPKLDSEAADANQRCAALEEELAALRKKMSQMQDSNKNLLSQVDQLTQQLHRLMEDETPVSSVAKSRTFSGTECCDGRFETASQTNVTASWNGGFYLQEGSPSPAHLALSVELDDITSCAMGIWESTLEFIRSSQQPPLGHGTGYCSRGAFLRLFLSAQRNIGRIDDLIALAETLKRSELQQVVEGVRFLMESALPDEDPALRNAIFGRGLNESAITAAQTSVEFHALARRIGWQLSSIICILFRRTTVVQLGTHPGRRIYVPGGCAGSPFKKGAGHGGAGGSLLARELKHDKPPPGYVYPGQLPEDDDAVDGDGDGLPHIVPAANGDGYWIRARNIRLDAKAFSAGGAMALTEILAVRRRPTSAAGISGERRGQRERLSPQLQPAELMMSLLAGTLLDGGGPGLPALPIHSPWMQWRTSMLGPCRLVESAGTVDKGSTGATHGYSKDVPLAPPTLRYFRGEDEPGPQGTLPEVLGRSALPSPSNAAVAACQKAAKQPKPQRCSSPQPVSPKVAKQHQPLEAALDDAVDEPQAEPAPQQAPSPSNEGRQSRQRRPQTAGAVSPEMVTSCLRTAEDVKKALAAQPGLRTSSSAGQIRTATGLMQRPASAAKPRQQAVRQSSTPTFALLAETTGLVESTASRGRPRSAAAVADCRRAASTTSAAEPKLRLDKSLMYVVSLPKVAAAHAERQTRSNQAAVAAPAAGPAAQAGVPRL
eukprot:TRINITY_DN38231_c0_g5_i1.p1 TRINITY_DN38231_c0_g5~~TRINITY_DN38231_c0_g5_i1.p1  ORF type:complete len:1194 (+),score=292.08 TRINITY_DN38231_c0_g5_i1:125-3706(+)